MVRKAVYGLKGMVRDSGGVVTEMGGRRSTLDSTLFVWRKKGRIIGIMVTQIDDFCFGGKEEFHRDIIGRMKEKLKISGEKEDDFRYLGMRIKNEEGRIRLDQQEYIEKMVIPEKKHRLKEKET